MQNIDGSKRLDSGASADKRLRCLIATMLVCALIAGASPSRATTTSNDLVSATVSDDGYGHITFWSGTPQTGSSLSFEQKSYVTIKANGRYYTNNDLGVAKQLADGMERVPDVILSNGVNTKLKDTIRTVWTTGDGFDIRQDVFPVIIGKRGQIVYSINIIDHLLGPLTAQAQYLLDVDVAGNDASILHSGTGAFPNWTVFSPSSPSDGEFTLAQIESPSPSAPGLIAQGFFDGSLAPTKLPLIVPDSVVLGDWVTVIDYTWGVPRIFEGRRYHDAAMLLSWHEKVVINNNGTDSLVEIAASSYGTGDNSLAAVPQQSYHRNKIALDYLQDPTAVSVAVMSKTETTVKLEIVDLLGWTVSEMTVPTNTQSRVSIGSLAHGVYLLRTTIAGETVQAKLLR